MNKVILIGNLTKDVKTVETSSGKKAAKFSIAINGQNVMYIDVEAWEKTGENCALYLKKGSKCCVFGYLRTYTYESKGVERTGFCVVATDVEFLSPKSKTDEK